MKKIILWIFENYFKFLVNELIDKRINEIVHIKVDERMAEFHRYFKSYVKDLNAFTASDVHYKDTGFILLVAKVKGKDFIHVIPMNEIRGMQEYKDKLNWLKDTFGARHPYIDAPYGIREKFMMDHF